MAKIVYIDIDPYNRKYVREILPDACRPIENWYNLEFASHCVEAPNDIKQNMLYDEDTGEFTEWVPTDVPYSKFGNILKEEIEKV